MKRKVKWIVGVDEAGRGPLAGPVSVGTVAVPFDFDWELISGVGDSKKISEKKREVLFLRAEALQKEGLLRYHVALVSEEIIDTLGISYAVRQGIDECFVHLHLDPEETIIRLDGLLRAPEVFRHQDTIIRGDALEPVIGLASILAKVTRDLHMVAVSSKYPEYDFQVHKGYGTQEHRKKIEQYGLSPIHRVSFCGRFVK